MDVLCDGGHPRNLHPLQDREHRASPLLSWHATLTLWHYTHSCVTGVQEVCCSSAVWAHYLPQFWN